MIQYLLSILLILSVAFVYRFILKPRNIYQQYLQKLQKLNYKVYRAPFEILGLSFAKVVEKDTKQGDSLKICKTVFRDHDVILSNSIHKVLIEFTHPDFIKDFYSQQHLYTYPKAKLITSPIARAMGRGIAFSEGQQWKRKRRIINAVFNFEFIKSMTGKIQRLCDKAIQQVEQLAVHKKQNQKNIVEYNIIDLTVRMFSSVVLQCFLGGATQETIQGKPVCLFMNQLIGDISQKSYQLLPLLLGTKFLDAGIRAKDRDINRRIALYKKWGLKFIQDKVQQTKKRLQNKELISKQPLDIIEALIRANQSKKDESQDIYSEKQILEQFSTFFIAGTDTTSHYVMTMIYLIAQSAEVQQKLRNQIEKFAKDEDYSYENLKKFTYIDWIQKQTTRIYGPVSNLFLRQAKQDHYLNGLSIRKGTFVNINHMGNHYSQKYFKNPQIFRPERWQSECNEINPFVMGGFSAGPRTCIGKHLVMIQSKIGLIKFMKRYSKIQIPGPIRYVQKFVYTPDDFASRMTINQ